MSIRNRWRLTLASLVAILLAGTAITAMLTLGLADPARAGAKKWTVSSPNDWPHQSLTANLEFYQSPNDLPLDFTLELVARNDGPASSAWGIQLMNVNPPMTILIDNQGYFSVSQMQPEWVEFPHLQPNQANKLYLHVAENGQAIIRINDEIVRHDSAFFTAAGQWGIVRYRQPQLVWRDITLYYP